MNNFGLIVKRLSPEDDLKKEIACLAKINKITSGCIINAVGSLTTMKVSTDAYMGREVIKEYGKLEIVSLIGTIGEYGSHLHIHIAGADIDGQVFGGHLCEGSIVKTTVELMILAFPDLHFLSERDPSTGFKELLVKQV